MLVIPEIVDCKSVHLWLTYYSITHQLAQIALHHGRFPFQATFFYCRGCSYISGELKGGPYAVTQVTDEGGVTTISGNNGEFVLRCLDVGPVAPEERIKI